MSMMNAEVYDALVEAGASDAKAKAAARSVGDLNQLVTKADIVEVKEAIARLEIRLMKWGIGAMIAQGGLIVALILGLLPLFL